MHGRADRERLDDLAWSQTLAPMHQALFSEWCRAWGLPGRFISRNRIVRQLRQGLAHVQQPCNLEFAGGSGCPGRWKTARADFRI
jgi:hypothetical protein